MIYNISQRHSQLLMHTPASRLTSRFPSPSSRSNARTACLTHPLTYVQVILPEKPTPLKFHSQDAPQRVQFILQLLARVQEGQNQRKHIEVQMPRHQPVRQQFLQTHQTHPLSQPPSPT